MNSRIVAVRNQLEQLRGKKDVITNEITNKTSQLNRFITLRENIEAAKNIVQLVAQQTQQDVEIYINDIVSSTLSAVYDEPYDFKIEFVLRRGRTEADLFFVRDGHKLTPMEESGGGTVDVASFAIRIAIWALNKSSIRNTIILDEPFKNLPESKLPRAVDILKRLSEELKLQIIMVSHSPVLIEGSDKSFIVTRKRGISYVEEVKQ